MKESNYGEKGQNIGQNITSFMNYALAMTVLGCFIIHFRVQLKGQRLCIHQSKIRLRLRKETLKMWLCSSFVCT